MRRVLKTAELDDGFSVEFEVEIDRREDDRACVEADLARLEDEIAGFDGKIAPLTNAADKIDYAVAAASGVLSGVVDSLFVGRIGLDLRSANEAGNAWADETIMKRARALGYTGDSLSGAIGKLEDKFPWVGDQAIYDFGGGRKHHLRDFTHHASAGGLAESIRTQLTGTVHGVNSAGAHVAVDMLSGSAPSMEALWKAILGWFGHLVSDMAGSSTAAGAGTGIPGPILSLAQELAALPLFRNQEQIAATQKMLERVFSGGMDPSLKFDLRTEVGLLKTGQAGGLLWRQAFPVLLNEVLVRAFYFLRRLRHECLAKKVRSAADLAKLDWKAVLPFRNRTIVRMLTIAHSTFSAADLGDAVVRGAVKSGGEPISLAAEALLHINCVGTFRTTIAIATDARMGVRRAHLRTKEVRAVTEQVYLLGARDFYLVGDTWRAAADATQSVALSDQVVERAAILVRDACDEISSNYDAVDQGLDDLDPETARQLLEELRGGLDLDDSARRDDG